MGEYFIRHCVCLIVFVPDADKGKHTERGPCGMEYKLRWQISVDLTVKQR